MSEGTKKGPSEDEYVKVLHTYSYQRDGRTICMAKDEILMLLKRSNDDWWQVIRQGEKRSFFAPTQYLESVSIPVMQMEQSVQQARHFKNSVGPQHSEEKVPTGRPQGLKLPLRESKSAAPIRDMHSPSNPLASHSYVTKIESTRIPMERPDPYPDRCTGTSSFKSESPRVPIRGLPPRNGSGDLTLSVGCSRGYVQQVSQESSSSHTSKSSLNDGSRCSTESLTQAQIRKHVIKAASHDELSSGDHCRSSIDISQPRAASNEELDSRYSSRDYLFRSNQLSYRHRSNSYDFKIFQKDLTFSEFKQGSLEKNRKPRISKDPSNRRRSWAVEEIRIMEHQRSSLKRGETQDASIVLDVPPKLPPKLKKHRPPDKFTSSSESVGKLEGPIDVKVQEMKSTKPLPPQTAPNIKRLSLDFDKGNLRHEFDSMGISENQRKAAYSRQETQDLKEFPVALPRKFLPSQSSLFDGKYDIRRSQSGGNIFMSQPLSASEVITRDNNGNQVIREKKEIGLYSGLKDNRRPTDQSSKENDAGNKVQKSNSFGKVPGTPDLLRKMEKTPDSLRKVYLTTETPRGRNNLDLPGRLTAKISDSKFDKGKEEDDLYPSRETPTPDSSRPGKYAYQFPSSPKINPSRIVFDDWGEYYDEFSKRPFFYNAKTREKRWKPPRKGIHSVSIPEVPPFGRGDGSQPQSPLPDYPASPKISHRPRYNEFENMQPSLSSGPSRSQTLPSFPSISPNKTGVHLPLGQSISLLTTPPAPPSSAKPSHVPATPTTPDSPEFREVDQSAALLDVLHTISPPKGWKQKYDAFSQRVYFHNQVTKERSKEAVWMTEVDIANLNDKQYIRKSYQSMMEFTKERQFEADVIEVSRDVSDMETRQGIALIEHKDASTKGLDKPAVLDQLARNTEQLARITCTSVKSPVKDVEDNVYVVQKEMEDDNIDSKIPPKKPPRGVKPKNTGSRTKEEKSSSIVPISVPTSPVVSDYFPIRSPPETPSVMAAGSRLSTFSPRSSSASVKGHSRSKSETINVDKMNMNDNTRKGDKGILPTREAPKPPANPRSTSAFPSKAEVVGQNLNNPTSLASKNTDKKLGSPSPTSKAFSHNLSSPSPPTSKAVSRNLSDPFPPASKVSSRPLSSTSPSRSKCANNSVPGVASPRSALSPKVPLKMSRSESPSKVNPSLSSRKSSKSPARKSPSRVSRISSSDDKKVLSVKETTLKPHEARDKQTLGKYRDKTGKGKEESKRLGQDLKYKKEIAVPRDKTKRMIPSSLRIEESNIKLHLTGPKSPVLRPKSPVPVEPYNKMLGELRNHNVMYGPTLQKSAEEGSPKATSLSTFSPKKMSRSKTWVPNSETENSFQRDRMHVKTIAQENVHLHVPSVNISPFHDIPVLQDPRKPRVAVRKSVFFSQEEDMCLEHTPLLPRESSSSHQLNFPGKFAQEPISPGTFSPDSDSEGDGATLSDDTEASHDVDKWLATSTEDGKIYYYEEHGGKSQWKLPEHDEFEESVDGKESLNRPTSPNESLRRSLLTENINEFTKNIEKEGFVHRTFLMREGKKCRKNWTHSYVRYLVGSFNSGASGILLFSKTKAEDKKVEMFEFFNTCYLERTSDKKTSRQQVLGLRNSQGTEVLLQFDDKDIADEWLKVLEKHDGMQLCSSPVQEKEEKKNKKGSEKGKRESLVENANVDNKGITDYLRSFIRKRPMKETLEKKGIYKESVFGSTLAELASQDKTKTPIFVLQCIKNIQRSDENLRTDGLYRISGNAAQIQKIRYEIAQRNYDVLSREKDVHNLSGSLKLFFRELKEPLIPFANYDDFIQATGSEFRRMNQQVEKLNKAVRRLPSENFETLKVLLEHLLRVTEYEGDNRMSVSNLAIVFGPCLLWPRVTTSSDLMTDVMLHNRVIEGLLADFPKIFQVKR